MPSTGIPPVAHIIIDDDMTELEILESGATGWDRFDAVDTIFTGDRWIQVYDPIAISFCEGARQARHLPHA